MKVLSFGSLNIDYVYAVDHIILPGETEDTGGREIHCGGKGLNQSIALSRAGVKVMHAGLVGEEGDALIEQCAENGVDTRFIRKVPGPSGHTVIQVDKKGQNSILLFGGANRQMTPDYIDEVLSAFGEGDLILLQNEINLLDEIIERAYAKKMCIVLNPSPYDGALSSCDLNKISYFIMNELEGEAISKEKTPDGMLFFMKEHYPQARTVLTLGCDGSMYQDADGILKQGIYEVKALDTTAAGDTFTGYFIASILKGRSPKEALSIAAKASSIAVTRHGAIDSIPVLSEVSSSVL